MKKKYLLLILLFGLFIIPFKGNADTPVKQIVVKANEPYVDTGKSFYMKADIYPKNATNKSVTWSTSDSTIASINPTTGGVTTKSKKGIVTLTATANDGSGISESITLKVGYNYIKLGERKYISSSVTTTYEDVIWDDGPQYVIRKTGSTAKSSINGIYRHAAEIEGVNIGIANLLLKTITDELISIENIEVYAPILRYEALIDNIVIPKNTTDNPNIYIGNTFSEGLGKTYYISDDETIATVDQSGNITGIKNGETTIRVQSQFNNIEKEIPVFIYTNVENINVDTEDVYLNDDNRVYQLTYDVIPNEATWPTVTFTSNNEEIVTINQIGLIQAVKNGETTITLSAQNDITKIINVHISGLRKDINELEINNLENKVYTGEAYTPEIVIHDGDYQLIKNTDYTVQYINNINAGTAEILIEGIGNYKLTKKVTFKILKANIEYESSSTTYPFDDLYHSINLQVTTPDVTIKYKDNEGNYTIDKKPKYKKVGIYPIDYKLSKENYLDVYGSETVEITKVDIVELTTTTENIDYGEVNQDFEENIQRKIIVKNTGNVNIKLNIKNPTSDGPFGCLDFDNNHELEPDEEYEITLIANANGTYHNVPGIYNGTYQIIATSLENKEDTYTLKVPATITIKKLPMKVSYTTHVQTYGWQDYVSNGVMAGTSGEAKRLEAIKIKLENQDYVGNIEYKTHIQTFGWEKEYKKNDEMSGTNGLAKRLEAIKIKLTGKISEHFDIYYRVHAQKFGWLGWARNDEEAGTAGFAYRLEGIEIRIIPKGTPFEEYGLTTAFKDKDENTPPTTPGQKPIVTTEEDDQTIEYTTHVQKVGWQDYVAGGKMAGTEGMAYRLEGIKIKLKNQKYSGNILYRTHIQTYGWEKEFKKNDEMSGTQGEAKRLEAIEIKLDGEMSEHYDIYYTVHAQKLGWLGWAKNGERAGTAGFAYRLEGIIIKLIPKGQEFSLKTKKPKAFYDANEQ